MSTQAQVQAPPPSGPGPWRSKPVLAALILVGAATVLLCLLLWPQWTGNPDLSHGLFMPVVFVVLLREGFTQPRARYLPDTAWTDIAAKLLLILAIAALMFGCLYAMALGWGHSMSALGGVAAFCCAGLAALLSLSRRSLRLIPFNWPSLAAVLLWLLCVQPPPGSYIRLTFKLQSFVTASVLNALQLLGIPATRHGNIIELANTSVGVEEACSGVRSLISCLFAGLFFSACLVRRTHHRILLVALAGPLAIGMNFLRSLLLTLLARKGVRIEGAWHDLSGFAILAVTALLLGGLALAFARAEEESHPAKPADTPTPSPEAASAPGWRRLRPLLIGYGVGLSLSLVALFATRSISSEARPGPDLEALLPLRPEAWQQVSSPDLLRFSEVLGTTSLVQRDYLRADARGTIQVTVYLAYWAPGQSSPSQVAIHTPDGCWPGSGWTRLPWEPLRGPLKSCGRLLPEAEQRLFNSSSGGAQHVWYWHLFDGHPIVQLNPYNVGELLEMSLRYGFRRSGDQLFVRISSNRPWEEIANDPLFGQIFAKLKPLGL